MNPKVDAYLITGCGRCPLANTPECYVNDWREALKKLRQIALDCGLTEELKWSVPCYTFRGKNILMLTALKNYCALTFFKGVLLKDSENILVRQTENVQAARQIRFTGAQRVSEFEKTLKDYINEAVEIENSGLQVDYKKTEDFPVPQEFQTVLDENSVLTTAFKALTPGRQKAYLLHFSQPKQSKTRHARVEKLIPQILTGKGLHD